jgi:hypothetical protein
MDSYVLHREELAAPLAGTRLNSIEARYQTARKKKSGPRRAEGFIPAPAPEGEEITFFSVATFSIPRSVPGGSGPGRFFVFSDLKREPRNWGVRETRRLSSGGDGGVPSQAGL